MVVNYHVFGFTGKCTYRKKEVLRPVAETLSQQRLVFSTLNFQRSIPLTLGLTGRDGGLSTLCHSCGFACHVYVYICIYIYICMYIYNIYIYIYKYIYIYIYIFTFLYSFLLETTVLKQCSRKRNASIDSINQSTFEINELPSILQI